MRQIPESNGAVLQYLSMFQWNRPMRKTYRLLPYALLGRTKE